MGASRTLKRAAAVSNHHPDTCERWSRENRWVARVAAWDDFLDKVKRDTTVSELAAMTRFHIRIASRIQLACMTTLERLEKDGRGIPAKQVAMAFKHAVQVERLARGLNDTSVKIDTGTKDEDAAFERLLRDPDARAQLDAIAARAARVEGEPGTDG